MPLLMDPMGPYFKKNSTLVSEERQIIFWFHKIVRSFSNMMIDVSQFKDNFASLKNRSLSFNYWSIKLENWYYERLRIRSEDKHE